MGQRFHFFIVLGRQSGQGIGPVQPGVFGRGSGIVGQEVDLAQAQVADKAGGGCDIPGIVIDARDAGHAGNRPACRMRPGGASWIADVRFDAPVHLRWAEESMSFRSNKNRSVTPSRASKMRQGATPLVSTAVARPRRRQALRKATAKSPCWLASPPLNVTPPPEDFKERRVPGNIQGQRLGVPPLAGELQRARIADLHTGGAVVALRAVQCYPAGSFVLFNRLERARGAGLQA